MSGLDPDLDPSRIRWLLDELVRRMHDAGIRGTIRIAGGAAMALRFPDDPEVRVTSDIDAIYEPRPEINAIIAAMADEFGLRPRWLNDSGAQWMRVAPSTNTVTIATTEELVAMKLAAGRVQDEDDLRIAARHLSLSTPEQLVDIAYAVYGEDAVELNDGRESYLLAAADVLARLDPAPKPKPNP